MNTTTNTAAQVEAINNKFLNAYKVQAKVAGKTWLTRGTVLTANNEAEATQKAKNVLMLTDEHEINIQPCKVYEIAAKLSTDLYPYGYLKTTAFFSVEHNNKGCRTVFQTINPKTGNLNKPKFGTYSPVILPCVLDNNMIEWCGYLDFNGTDSINRGLHFLNDFKTLLTPSQIKDFTLHAIAMSKVNAKAQVVYCGTDWDSLKPYYEQPIKNLVKIANGENTDFLACLLDFNAIEALKKPDYNPFAIQKIA